MHVALVIMIKQSLNRLSRFETESICRLSKCPKTLKWQSSLAPRRILTIVCWEQRTIWVMLLQRYRVGIGKRWWPILESTKQLWRLFVSCFQPTINTEFPFKHDPNHSGTLTKYNQVLSSLFEILKH